MSDNTQQGTGAILVLNSGSSSLKFSIYTYSAGDEQLVLEGRAEGIDRDTGTLRIKTASGEVLLDKKNIKQSQPDVLQKIAGLLADRHITPVAVGHRVVHGGAKVRDHQLATPAALAALQEAAQFAPLHVPQALVLIQQAQAIFPCPHCLCLDNAFHRTMPEVAKHFPLPTALYEQGVIRYGFHGLSFESLVHKLGLALPRRAIFAHLGNGSSITAVFDGQSIDTSMGLTPTGGVPMGSRSGDLDPGIILYLLREQHLTAQQLSDLLNNQSGFTAFSNGESDMQALESRASTGDPTAELAIHAFATAVRKYIGAYAALMGGVDLLVFSGGIGQNSTEVRTRICDGLGFLGLSLSDSSRVLILETEEERQIARHSRRLITPA